MVRRVSLPMPAKVNVQNVAQRAMSVRSVKRAFGEIRAILDVKVPSARIAITIQEIVWPAILNCGDWIVKMSALQIVNMNSVTCLLVDV